MDTKTGDIAVDIELPFATGGLVGIGQALDVDPTTGDVIVVGQGLSPTGTSLGHHFVVRVEYKTKAVKVIANLTHDDPGKAPVKMIANLNVRNHRIRILRLAHLTASAYVSDPAHNHPCHAQDRR